MTFIVAVQLKDSIIVASDNKYIQLKDKKVDGYQECLDSKLYGWHSGIITGAGEHYVIDKAVRLFINNADSDLEKLPACLNISRQIREMEVGYHEQIQSSKLLYSSYNENGTTLYTVEPTEELGKYQTSEFKENDLIIWLYNPNIENISENIKNFYLNLRPKADFDRVEDWMDYYISPLAEIYAKQSCIDSFMSNSFDIFFQIKNEYFYRHIKNTTPFSINSHSL
jgi:hypothetical protein